jgi:hypothetical protein
MSPAGPSRSAGTPLFRRPSTTPLLTRTATIVPYQWNGRQFAVSRSGRGLFLAMRLIHAPRAFHGLSVFHAALPFHARWVLHADLHGRLLPSRRNISRSFDGDGNSQKWIALGSIRSKVDHCRLTIAAREKSAWRCCRDTSPTRLDDGRDSAGLRQPALSEVPGAPPERAPKYCAKRRFSSRSCASSAASKRRGKRVKHLRVPRIFVAVEKPM